MSYMREYKRLCKMKRPRVAGDDARLLYLAQVMTGNFTSIEKLVRDLLPRKMQFDLRFNRDPDSKDRYGVEVLVHHYAELHSEGTGSEIRIAAERCLESLGRKVYHHVRLTAVKS